MLLACHWHGHPWLCVFTQERIQLCSPVCCLFPFGRVRSWLSPSGSGSRIRHVAWNLGGGGLWRPVSPWAATRGCHVEGPWEPGRDLFSHLLNPMMLTVELWAAPFFPEPTSFFSCPATLGVTSLTSHHVGHFKQLGFPDSTVSSLPWRQEHLVTSRLQSQQSLERQRVQWRNMSVF